MADDLKARHMAKIALLEFISVLNDSSVEDDGHQRRHLILVASPPSSTHQLSQLT